VAKVCDQSCGSQVNLSFVTSAIAPAQAQSGKISMRSILTTFYEQLLSTQTPKVQKYTDVMTVFLCFWDLGA